MTNVDAVVEEQLWLISVKTVGAERQGDGVASVIPSSFDVRVKPSDDVRSLHNCIETVTGLKESQQRLIYRGRLIQSHQNEGTEGSVIEPTKISEIKGLADGHTIHLVRRQDSAEGQVEGGNTTATAAAASNTTENDSNNTESGSGSGTSSLLAALLGLSALDEESEESGTAPQRSPGSWRRTHRNRNTYRLTHEDLEVPDPGSMESVRQGLMTLHTLLPIAETHQNNIASNPNSLRNPLEHNRRWYLGQWIDCRDTVNQWLEATIVQIVRPEEILPPRQSSTSQTTATTSNVAGTSIHPAVDPAVGSADLDGRRRLLLESCEVGDAEDMGGEFAGFRRRSNNDNVHLLLIHYNGWPHRWDEWIRSDSERIRPFRVRTRHPTSSNWVSPTTQSHYADSPSTNIGGETDAEDRSHLLHEIIRATSAVHSLAQRAADALPTPPESSNPRQNDLPWTTPISNVERATTTGTSTTSTPAITENNESTADEASTPSPEQNLAMLAPLLDRLGRTLVDAAPHIASLAASNGADSDLAAGGSTDEEAGDGDVEETGENTIGTNPNSLSGLLSLLNRERGRRSSRTSQSQQTDQALSHASEGTHATVDPDFMDFATGLVNVSRGDVRSGPRSRSGRDEISGLLGAYLAAASLGGLGSLGDGDDGNNEVQGLGRLLRNQGTNGENGGIDIHIHAVVTAPGMPPGAGIVPGAGGGGVGGGGGPGGGGGAAALALGLGGGPLGTATTPPDLFANTRRATAQRVRATLLEQNDDMGIFDELYSETPDPVSPSASSDSASSPSNENNTSESRQSGSFSRRNSRRSSPNNSNHRASFFGRLFRRNGSAE